MKIKKLSSKKLAPLPRQLSDLIRRLETDEEDKIPSIVCEIREWRYGRGDLFHWVTVLDRFDLILARICTDYNLKDIQLKPFDPTTKTLIMSILHLSSVLFENCTNRNIYNSYEYLSMFLNTFDIDVLQEVLHFMIRPAQRINNPKAIRSSFVVPQDKIMELARGWNNLPADLLSIAQELVVTPKMMTLNIQFYRTAVESQSNEGYELVNYVITEDDIKQDDFTLFQRLVKEHDIPEDYHFELANRIRITKHINQPIIRRRLLSIRILAISIMSHAISESTAQNKVFIYEPHLISQLAELISPENHVDMEIQTYVLYALDAITRHRSKLTEVLTAVNASANHGTMMQILRKTNTNNDYTQPFLDALFTFVSYLLQTPQGGQMLMTAGIIPTLVHIVDNHQYTQLKNISKIVGLIDTIVNSYSTSFSAFCNADGLDVLLHRIKSEVDACTSHPPDEDDLPAPYDRLSAIKAMLKFLLRMMESSGTADGLRNLIDSTLPKSLRLIMEYPKRFGNSIFSLAIHVSTTFIHNEPTSLPILQEAKLPQIFLRTISKYESPNSEVLIAAVNAFGAMCLNAQGLDMFNKEKPLPHFFELMTSHEFLGSSADVDSATGLGSTMDELIRHHPSLKRSVFDCVTTMIKKVLEMGSDVNGIGKPSDNSHQIHAQPDTDEKKEYDDKPEKVECLLVSFIDLVSRFLEGLFQNQSNINEFVEGGCPEMLLSYFSLPLLPAAFSVTIASDSLSYLFRMISEVSPLPTVLAIAAKVKESIASLSESYQKDSNRSMLLDFIDIHERDKDKITKGNKVLRQMVQLHGYVGLLSNICCSSVLTHGKNAVSLVSEFLSESEEENIIQLLGQLHRNMTWENLLLKEGLPPAWYAFKYNASQSSSLALKKSTVGSLDHALGIYNSTTNDPTQVESSPIEDSEEVPSAKDPRMLNLKYFKLLLTEIPQLLLPIFQGLIKVSLSRRTGNSVPKPQTMKLAVFIAKFLIENMTWSSATSPSAPVCKYDYFASVYSMTSVLLKDERTQSSLQTPLAVAFERQKGIDLLIDNLKDLCDKRLELHKTDEKKEDKKTQDTIGRINNCIECLLAILPEISSRKALRDSPYTAALINKNTKSPDYFDPNEWVTSIELKLIPLKEYLTSDQADLFSKAALQTLLKIFQQIMKCEAEINPPQPSRASDPYTSFAAPLLNSPFALLRTPVVASERHIQTLMDMGFQRTAAEQALARCNNQVSRAVDYLFSHPTPIVADTAPRPEPTVTTTLNNAPNRATSNAGELNFLDEYSTAPSTQSHPSDHENDEDQNDDHDDEDEEEEDDNDEDGNDEDEGSDMDEDIDSFMHDDTRADRQRLTGYIRSLMSENMMSEGAESSSSKQSVSDNAKKLKAIRNELCDTLIPSLLNLSDTREDMVFDVRDLLVIIGKYEDDTKEKSAHTSSSTTATSVKIITQLMDNIAAIRNDPSKSVLLSVRLRLLALLLREPPMQHAMIQLAYRFSFLFDMLNFLNIPENENLPPSSATILLVLDAFIAQSDGPKKAKLVAMPNLSEDEDSDDPMEADDEPSTTVTSEQRAKVLECCVSLLRRPKLSRDDIYAILRMVVRLTKDHAIALQFVEAGGIPLLFTKPKFSLEGLQGQQAFIILILRHIVECKSVLIGTMEDIITNWFTNPRPRNMDINSFIRHNAQVALRSPATFIDVAVDVCRIVQVDDYRANPHIKLRKLDDGADLKKNTEEKSQTSSSELVVHYLLDEIMAVRASAVKKEGELSESAKKEENLKFVYTGFLLQCLVELISSYASCKYDIYNYCRKQTGHHRAGEKHAVSFVSMLLHDLLPYNYANPLSEESRKEQGLSTWAASILVAMSYDVSANVDMNSQQKTELIQVRKFVMESIVRALKEAVNSTETASSRYSRYLALADLCYRILNARPNSGAFIPRLPNQHNQQNSTTKEDVLSNSKIMLDKNFVAVLTTAINDIDINYPHSKSILNAMLRPLEQLTKLAIKIEDSASDTDKDDQDKMDTVEEDIHLPSTPIPEGEEAPDLYRNSALGMFDAGSVIDEDEYNSDEYSDMFGSSGEEEDDFDEDSGSDLSDMSEGDDDEEVDEEMVIRGRGYDSDEMDEDEDENEIEVEAEIIDESDEDEDGSREMTWHLEDIEEEPGIVHAETVIDTGDERDEQSHLGRISDAFEGEDEFEALSDFDEVSENMEGQSDNDIADTMLLTADEIERPFLTSDLIVDEDFERSRPIYPVGLRRRFPQGRRMTDGRSFRSPGAVPGQEDVITHPLLSNTANNPRPGGLNYSAGDDAFPHSRGHGTHYSNWQDFEDIIGGNAVRMLEDLLTHTPSGNQSTPLRVDIQNGLNGPSRSFEFDRLPSALNISSTNNANNRPINSDVQDILSFLNDFQPMSSAERWHQEALMMYGNDINEKASKLINDILNRLIPIALEDDKKMRAEEEVKRVEKRRKDEEDRRKAEEEKWRIEKEAKAAAAAAAEEAQQSTSAAAADSPAATTTNASADVRADAPTESTPEASANTTTEPERVTISINGEDVDITGLGMDVEFLEALPDDLREEVVNQHRRNMPTAVEVTVEDSINPEFLNALPPDIREEVLHQEAIERVRRERINRQAQQSSNAVPSAGSLGRRLYELQGIADIPSSADSSTKPDSEIGKKRRRTHRRDGAIQLVDKSQLATLVRLLFVPQTISKSLLNRLLLNLCENSKTRGDLLSYLVCVLHDGDNDLASVDNSFAHLSSNGSKTGKISSSQKAKNSGLTGANDNVPNFIAQRCLEALTYIVSCNEQSMSYFLTESESLVSLKKVSFAGKKGKSKEKVPIIWNKYPILVLMNLLDRPVFINNSPLMGQLMDLLSTMCRPFPLLVKKYEEKVEIKQKDPKQSERSMPKPPTIPDYYLKLVVHVLTNGECSSKTFQYTLNAISHLSALNGAQQAIVNELVADATHSGTRILSDLGNLLNVLESHMTGTEIGSTVLSPFSAATSYQAKLLRVLKTLDYMFSRKITTTGNETDEEKAAIEQQQAKNEKQLLQIYESLDFLPLWKTLGKCLSVIHEKEELINVATVLLPLIESFMVMSKCAAEKGHVHDLVLPSSPVSENWSLAAPESYFFAFTERHKKVLNIMVRNNPTLMSGSFALLVRNPKMLEFDNKRNYFVQQLKRSSSRENYTMLQLNVRRQYVFEDSYHQLQGRTGEEIRDGKLSVRFYDEEGVDAGGVTREWFSVLARQMFDPNYALFITSAADKLTYQPNRASAVNSDHLSFFKFVGRVIGKAIYDGRLLDAYFTRSFYKHILGRPVDYRDVEALDPEYYKSLVWMLENDITDIIDLTFSMETDYFGTKETIDLKPNGRMIPVTEANKHEYVTLVTEQKLTTAIKDQINAFVQGFHDIIPAPLIQIFNEQELELLISGLPDIDIDDWKNNTEYQGYTASSSPVQWFWRAVRSFDQEERAKLLQFATGTSKVPLEGFAHLQGSNGVQKFQIHKDFGGENRLPSAHTCFNQIDLPQYDSYESLRANLFKAISECSTGFAFV
ncbi:hypothetical protein BDB01DRAFT_852215 [Pilobolus umbonatus]|nr:hypothetical protein BDB01DRAFT_852215 [Pilobolus umbonatus]